MTMNSHIHELRRKHEALSDAVSRAHRSPGVDDLQIAEMKKKKLRLKEEISRLSSQFA
ncbi:YdcH family protein [Albirhodobacter sp. R86504]|uniref:YdcH family protein n=1 Tax=Albirhodobacter sp. R86504 TaxID=3093848 RepID=UPI00366A57B1